MSRRDPNRPTPTTEAPLPAHLESDALYNTVYPPPARRPDNVPNVSGNVVLYREWRSSLARTPQGYPWLDFPSSRQMGELGIPAFAQIEFDGANRYVLEEHLQSNPQEPYHSNVPGEGQNNVRVVARYADDVLVVDRVVRPLGQPQNAS